MRSLISAIGGLTALSTIAQNNRRMAMIEGDSGTLEGNHVPDGILTSIIGIDASEVDTPQPPAVYIYIYKHAC
jgi:hypothetical protein